MAVSNGIFNFPPNPNISELLIQAAQETDPVIKAQLTAQAYAVTAPLTEEEKNAYGYLQADYIQNNPGLVGNRETSYVGIISKDDILDTLE